MPVFSHPKMPSLVASIDVFQAWRVTKVLVDNHANQLRLAVVQKRSAAQPACAVLREARVHLRKLVNGDPWKLEILDVVSGTNPRPIRKFWNGHNCY